jgi:hypothetical protein
MIANPPKMPPPEDDAELPLPELDGNELEELEWDELEELEDPEWETLCPTAPTAADE